MVFFHPTNSIDFLSTSGQSAVEKVTDQNPIYVRFTYRHILGNIILSTSCSRGINIVLVFRSMYDSLTNLLIPNQEQFIVDCRMISISKASRRKKVSCVYKKISVL